MQTAIDDAEKMIWREEGQKYLYQAKRVGQPAHSAGLTIQGALDANTKLGALLTPSPSLSLPLSFPSSPPFSSLPLEVGHLKYS